MKQYTHAVVIGRFEPAHNAHFALFQKALSVADNLIIVLGSHDAPRTIKNPWTSQERMEMIRSSLDPIQNLRVHFVTVCDTIYNDAEWVSTVQQYVTRVASQTTDGEPYICIVAHDKDESTYYINYFKSWDTVDIPAIAADAADGPAISATKVRELFFEGYLNLLKSAVPNGVLEFLKNFYSTQEYATLKQEYVDAVGYDSKFENAPYGNTNFLTSDAMVVQSGHVLLIQRAKAPGKGLWALPGGHLQNNETFFQGALRELKEETSIKVPEKVLAGSLVYDHVFDHPDRSLRGRVKKKIGRTVTRLFVFKLDDSTELPKVKPADDAQDAWWFSFAEVKQMRSQLFEDHFDMIMHGLSRL